MSSGVLWSPWTFGVLVALTSVLVFRAFAPVQPLGVRDRLDGYLGEVDITEEQDMRLPFSVRVLKPLLMRLLNVLGRLVPKRNMERTAVIMQQAGEPGGLTVLDFYGLRMLFAIVVGIGCYVVMSRSFPFAEAARNALVGCLFGYFLPSMWLSRRAKGRQHQIVRAMPDALDMLTIGVEAGLAFESALLVVGQKWDNALTREFARSVAEMRVGIPRDEALQRMAERVGVQELTTFVAILVQSSQLGVSISEVLHTQAAEMRLRRRQRAEELARQAGIKMIFPLTFLIFPAMLVVILGPSLPAFKSFLGGGMGMGMGGME
ncbi:type II secretion system F family protein [Chloroflexota bacterium]